MSSTARASSPRSPSRATARPASPPPAGRPRRDHRTSSPPTRAPPPSPPRSLSPSAPASHGARGREASNDHAARERRTASPSWTSFPPITCGCRPSLWTIDQARPRAPPARATPARTWRSLRFSARGGGADGPTWGCEMMATPTTNDQRNEEKRVKDGCPPPSALRAAGPSKSVRSASLRALREGHSRSRQSASPASARTRLAHDLSAVTTGDGAWSTSKPTPAPYTTSPPSQPHASSTQPALPRPGRYSGSKQYFVVAAHPPR